MIKGIINKYFRMLLWKVFKFERWHISLLSQREYAQDVIEFSNKKNFDSIVEIGTGIGDVIRNIYAKKKLCLDLEKNILKANKFLSFFINKGNKNIDFEEFDIYKCSLTEKYDLIIMLNWIHNIESKVLQKSFSKFINQNLNKNGYLIFDILENKSYKYNHDIEYLLEGIKNIDIVVSDKKYEYDRKLIYVRLNR
jgi:hypothetical protein